MGMSIPIHCTYQINTPRNEAFEIVILQILMSVQITMEDVIKHVQTLLGAINAAVKVVTCSTKMVIAAMVR